MPKAVIIEFTGASSVTIVTNNGHGNTVKSAFLFEAPAGWDADVISCPNDFGVKAYEWIEARTATYTLAICSNVIDVFYTRNIEKIQRVLGIPLFLSLDNSGSTSIYEQGTNAVYSGAGTESNVAETSFRNMTFDSATNLAPASQNLTSYTNAVIAGKCAPLVDAGLTAAQIWQTVRQQAASYPTWTAQNGYGKAPTAYTVPESYAVPPVLASEAWRSSNTLNVVFAYLAGTTPTHFNVYRDGVLDGSYAFDDWTATTASSLIGTLDQYRISHNVVSDGGSFTFTFSLTYAEGESLRNYGTSWVVSGFTDNFEPPDPDPVPPEPEPEPEPPYIPPEVNQYNKTPFSFWV